ncbi:hypothetical protein EO244_13690 [Ancylomarina salipaludis]|uniref:Uncharacterized protein n=1 Tax=Ancylomarina salipaludis TaxID=2501299 RepID=A0A4Q1JIV9_9BACT|nr:hypothetical protein [Ancylomarina salipaludis]RXQ89830.1 hypothetical protein EO244_13690 [Ancylomarina salipaludis]
MKRLALLLLIMGFILFSSQNTNAQENKTKKEAKVKVHINKDGKSVKFDTIIHDFKDQKEIMKIIKSRNIPDSLLKNFEGEDLIWVSDDKDSHDKHKVIIKEFLDCDSMEHSKMKRSICKHVKVIFEDDDIDIDKDMKIIHINSKSNNKVTYDGKEEVEIEINDTNRDVKKTIKKKRFRKKKSN